MNEGTEGKEEDRERLKVETFLSDFSLIPQSVALTFQGFQRLMVSLLHASPSLTLPLSLMPTFGHCETWRVKVKKEPKMRNDQGWRDKCKRECEEPRPRDGWIPDSTVLALFHLSNFLYSLHFFTHLYSLPK